MEGLNYCLLCGETSPNDNSNETNTTLFVTSKEFRTVFQCFLKLFEVDDPPWFEKAFVFCSECTRMLTVVSELENVLKEVEKRLKESEQVVKDRLKGSEVKFEKSGLYIKDQRYWKVRGPFISKEKKSTEAELPPPSLATTPQEVALEMEVINPSVAELYFNEAEDDDEQQEQNIVISPASTPTSQEENMTTSSKRSREPATRFNYHERKSKRTKVSERGKTKSVEMEVEHDIKPVASSATAITCDPTSFAQQLEGGVVEYIKVEVDPPPPDTDDDDDEREDQMRKGVRTEQFNRRLTNPFRLKCEVCEELLPNKPSLALHIRNVHQQSKEVYQNLIDVKAKETANRWLTPGHPEVSYFGVRLFKVGDGKQYQCSACEAIIPYINHNPQSLLLGHVVQHHKNLYKCDQCEERFPDQKTLTTHTDNVHTGQAGSTIISPRYHCPICQMPIMKNIHEVTIHMWTHYNKKERQEALEREEMKPNPNQKPFECDKCSMRFFNHKLLLAHFKKYHDPSKKYNNEEVTTLDDSTFSFHDVILKKVANFAGKESYKCSSCNDAVIAKSLIVAKAHVVAKHTRFYKCDHCERRFPSEAMLKLHLEMKHLKTTPFPCHVCGLPFFGVKPTKNHLWTHYSAKEKQEALARGEKVPYQVEGYHCEKCGRRFACNSTLRQHQRKAHEGEQVPKKICGVCGAEVINLDSHMRFTHAKEEDYRFVCTLCNRKFVSHHFLKNHKKSCGVVEKNFKCEVCAREFKLKEQLEKHRKAMHLNIRPHQCSQCPMAFANRVILRRHIKGKHEGKKFKQYPRRTPRSQLKKYVTKVKVEKDTSGSGE